MWNLDGFADGGKITVLHIWGGNAGLIEREEVRVTTLDSCNGADPQRAEVEVRSHFDGRWVGGFEIADVNDDRYLLRRRSDGAMLPVAFPAHEVRSLHPHGAPPVR